MRTGISAVVAGLAGATLSLGGCVVAIGNDSYDSGRVRLSASELERVVAIDSRDQAPSVRTRHADSLAALGPETSVAEFRALFPSATFVERRQTPVGVIDAYCVRVEEVYRYRGRSYGHLARDERWFYFAEGRFVKIGAPGEFPP